jgi:hypothetical protein
VSPLKRSEGKGVSYFDGEIQTGKDEIRRFVSFRPEKLHTFESAVELKEAVTLINPRFTVNRRKTEITIAKNTQLEIATKRLECPRQEVISKSEEKSIKDIAAAGITVSDHL